MQESRPQEGVKLHTKGRVTNGPTTEVDGDVFSFRGGSTGIVKFLEPLSPLLNYFEYVIEDCGQEAAIGVGCGDRGYPMSRMPGWNRNSCGYHADDGKLYHESGMGRAFGPTCTTGDRMGCGLNFDCDLGQGVVQVFFTKNGKQVGEMERMKRPVNGIYPLIGLHSRGEVVRYLGHWQRAADGVAEPMEQDCSPGTTWLRANGVKFVDDGLTLEYAGMGGNLQDVGIAQARYPLNRTSHYFEMEIMAGGSLGALALGLAKTTYPLHRHPGWNPGAVGYHADDGKLFRERGHGENFGPSCTAGDRMGCGIRFPLHGEREEVEEGSEGSEASDEESGEEAEGRLVRRYSPSGSSDSTGSEHSDESEESYSGDSLLDDLMPQPPGPLLGRGFHFGARPMMRQALVQAARPLQHRQRNSSGGSGRTCMVYFTKNGEKVGETECNVPRGGFYPVVALLSHGEKLRVNFNPLSG